jgi:hypothetical protein
MLEKKEREREELLQNSMVEGEQIRQSVLEFANYEISKMALKKERQLQMRRELEQLI